MCLLAQQAVSAASLLRKSDARVVHTILRRRGGRWCPRTMSWKTEVNDMCLVLENGTTVPLIVQPPLQCFPVRMKRFSAITNL